MAGFIFFKVTQLVHSRIYRATLSSPSLQETIGSNLYINRLPLNTTKPLCLNMARYYNSSAYYYDFLQYLAVPIEFLFLLAVVLVFLILNWYINYDYMLEDIMDYIKMGLMLIPVLLLIILHLVSRDPDQAPAFSLSLPEKNSIHRIGGSPLGIGILLIFLIFMITHHSSFHDQWYPLFSTQRRYH